METYAFTLHGLEDMYQVRMYACMYVCMCVCSIWKRTYTLSFYMNSGMRKYIHSNLQAYIHIYILVKFQHEQNLKTCIYTYMYMYMYTYIYIHIYKHNIFNHRHILPFKRTYTRLCVHTYQPHEWMHITQMAMKEKSMAKLQADEIYVYMYMCVYVYIYVCNYSKLNIITCEWTHKYIYIYIYIYI